jgi:hypothetical protein
LGSLQVFFDLKHTPQEFESFLVAVGRVSDLGLEAEVKNPIVRQLLEYHGIARAVASRAEGFVDNLFREVSAVRFGQKLWLSNDNKDKEIGADTALPLGFEPSVIERLYKLTFKAVGKSTWDTDSRPCLLALKHAGTALAEAMPPAAQDKEHQRESTVGAASVGEHTPKSTGGSVTEEHANTESKDATVQEADVKAVDEDTASEACDASGVEPESCEPPRVQGKNMKTDVDKQKLAVNDIVRLSMQRNKNSMMGTRLRS